MTCFSAAKSTCSHSYPRAPTRALSTGRSPHTFPKRRLHLAASILSRCFRTRIPTRTLQTSCPRSNSGALGIARSKSSIGTVCSRHGTGRLPSQTGLLTCLTSGRNVSCSRWSVSWHILSQSAAPIDGAIQRSTCQCICSTKVGFKPIGAESESGVPSRVSLRVLRYSAGYSGSATPEKFARGASRPFTLPLAGRASILGIYSQTTTPSASTLISIES